ncbi:MAG: hypothetical protein C0515_00070 [Novosphingobium sp.]|nr:hypothetical protein [Novosphingobium sp.]
MLEVLKAAAPTATAFIAFQALKNWRHQERAKREIEFLSELVDSSHAYIYKMERPIALLRMNKIGVRSHIESWKEGDESEKELRGAIAYIEKNGEVAGKRLSEALNDIRPEAIKLQTLQDKGQMFKFTGYANCYNAVTNLVWHFRRLQSFATMLDPHWYWENPEVKGLLQKVLTIEPDEIRDGIAKSNSELISFAQTTYQSHFN